MTDRKRPNLLANPLELSVMLRSSPPPLDHVLPGLLAKTVGLLVGPGAVSKTMLSLQLGIAMATGTPVLEGLLGDTAASGPQRVVLVLAEETAEVVWHRLHAIAAVQLAESDIDPAHSMALLEKNLVIHALGGKGQVNLLGEGLMPTESGEQLRTAAAGARLVILDPLRDFHDADENDSAAMKALARHIASYAASTGAAWLLVHHSSRASAINGFGGTADAGRGSTALTNAVRWQMNLSRPTREQAKQLKLGADQLHDAVLLDIPKANYVQSLPTRVVKRGPHGVLVSGGRA
jgi:regulatory protein RepA